MVIRQWIVDIQVTFLEGCLVKVEETIFKFISNVICHNFGHKARDCKINRRKETCPPKMWKEKEERCGLMLYFQNQENK